jgi:cell division ATPase FtsA
LSKETFYTAVDIGSNKVCSIVARVGAEGDLKILGTGIVTSQGMQKGRIDNIDEVKALLKLPWKKPNVISAGESFPVCTLVSAVAI